MLDSPGRMERRYCAAAFVPAFVGIDGGRLTVDHVVVDAVLDVR